MCTTIHGNCIDTKLIMRCFKSGTFSLISHKYLNQVQIILYQLNHHTSSYFMLPVRNNSETEENYNYLYNSTLFHIASRGSK